MGGPTLDTMRAVDLSKPGAARHRPGVSARGGSPSPGELLSSPVCVSSSEFRHPAARPGGFVMGTASAVVLMAACLD